MRFRLFRYFRNLILIILTEIRNCFYLSPSFNFPLTCDIKFLSRDNPRMNSHRITAHSAPQKLHSCNDILYFHHRFFINIFSVPYIDLVQVHVCAFDINEVHHSLLRYLRYATFISMSVGNPPTRMEWGANFTRVTPPQSWLWEGGHTSLNNLSLLF
jgi:hypothetical protein